MLQRLYSTKNSISSVETRSKVASQNTYLFHLALYGFLTPWNTWPRLTDKAYRIIAQVVIVGTQVFGRAFISAWKQAAVNSAAASGTSGSAGAGAVKDAITRSTGLTVEEACQILNLKKEFLASGTAEASGPASASGRGLLEIRERYTRMFEANDPKTGGSFYIQSKVLRAKERLEMELAGSGDATKPEGGEGDVPPSGTASSAGS